MGDDGADGGIARDVGRGSQHVEDAIHAEDERNACGGNTFIASRIITSIMMPGAGDSGGADRCHHGGDV